MSGIGDSAVLERAGIEVKLDLPGVGMNVQEHLYSGVTFGASRNTDLACGR
jgi:choline dehydrogenase-like flavoprotein